MATKNQTTEPGKYMNFFTVLFLSFNIISFINAATNQRVTPFTYGFDFMLTPAPDRAISSSYSTKQAELTSEEITTAPLYQSDTPSPVSSIRQDKKNKEDQTYTDTYQESRTAYINRLNELFKQNSKTELTKLLNTYRQKKNCNIRLITLMRTIADKGDTVFFKDMLQYCRNHGCIIANLQDDTKKTLLMHYADNQSILEIIIGSSVRININLCDSKNKSVLFYLIDKNSLEGLRTVLNYKHDQANLNQVHETSTLGGIYKKTPIGLRPETPLETAIFLNNPDIIDLLVQKNVDILKRIGAAGYTPFAYAMTISKKNTVIHLLRKYKDKLDLEKSDYNQSAFLLAQQRAWQEKSFSKVATILSYIDTYDIDINHIDAF